MLRSIAHAAAGSDYELPTIDPLSTDYLGDLVALLKFDDGQRKKLVRDRDKQRSSTAAKPLTRRR